MNKTYLDIKEFNNSIKSEVLINNSSKINRSYKKEYYKKIRKLINIQHTQNLNQDRPDFNNFDFKQKSKEEKSKLYENYMISLAHESNAAERTYKKLNKYFFYKFFNSNQAFILRNKIKEIAIKICAAEINDDFFMIDFNDKNIKEDSENYGKYFDYEFITDLRSDLSDFYYEDIFSRKIGYLPLLLRGLYWDLYGKRKYLSNIYSKGNKLQENSMCYKVLENMSHVIWQICRNVKEPGKKNNIVSDFIQLLDIQRHTYNLKYVKENPQNHLNLQLKDVKEETKALLIELEAKKSILLNKLKKECKSFIAPYISYNTNLNQFHEVFLLNQYNFINSEYEQS